MERKTKIFIGVFVIILLIIAGVYFFEFGNFTKNESFTTNTILLKLNIPLSGEVVNTIKITNEKNSEQTFKIYFDNLGSLASLDESEFSISAKGSKDVKITFKDSSRKIDAYTGEMIIEGKTKKIIPVVLTVQNDYNDLALIQKTIPKYNSVNPGGKLGMDIKILNLKDNELHNLKMNYQVRNLKNEIILSEDENLAVSDSLTTSKIFDIPKSFSYGNYVFITTVIYDSSEIIATNFFEIEKMQTTDINSSFIYIIVIILVFTLGVFIMFFYSVQKRDELVSRLKNQQETELSGNVKVLNKYEEELKEEKDRILKEKINELEKIKQKTKEAEDRERKLEKLEEEKVRIAGEYNSKLEELKKEKTNLVCRIKQKQKNQINEIKTLKKKGNKKEEIKKKLKDWQKEAVKMKEFKKEIKVIPREKIQKELQQKQKEIKKEFMNKFYSNLGKKDIKMK